uniref:GOST seven transmembrane domain-containing protein n=1 Tax=Arcella intermedia TaxID=1963864 RepID=A0A6B2L5C0_9EUKA
MAQLGLCKKENTLIFNASLDRSDIYYRALNFSQYQSGTAFLDEFALLKHTGIWYIYLANCGSSAGSGVSLFLNGKIEWKNPYGYLPGQILGFLPLYWLMSFFYFFMAVAWVVLTVKYRKDIMDLQHGIAIVIFISLIENLTWAGDYTSYNIKGINSDVVNVFGALFSSAKLTLVRTLMLVVAIGYTITRPELTMRYKALIVLLTLLYFITVTTSQYITVSETAGNTVPMEFQVATTIFLIIFNVTFFVWIGVEMLGTVRNLKNNESLKLTMYKRLALLLILSIILSVTIVVLQIMIQITDTSDTYFRVWWLWEGYWEFIYFACISFVAWVWRPSDHNSRYAYAKIGMEDNQEVEMEMEVGLEEENGEEKKKEDKSSSSSLSGLEDGEDKDKEPNDNQNDSGSDLSD